MTLQQEVSLQEPLTRYINHRKYIKNGIVQGSAFQPSPKDGRISVFRIAEWSAKEIWEKGNEIFKAVPHLKGRADFKWELFQNTVLRIEPDPLPNRHASITGLPRNKEEVDEWTLMLAKNSVFHPAPG